MCGIAGFVGNFESQLLDQMSAALTHRGPDDAGVWTDAKSRVGLAHRRLSIIDLSERGHQPMWDATGQVVIVFNGEIFNFKDLRHQLRQDGFAFKSDSDTEVILNLYLKYGRGMLTRLNGMFAFALWDTRDKSLLIARDGVGVKPLYYSETREGLLFASELKALLCSSAVERSLDHRAIYDYLTYLWCPAPRTMLESVKKLEPGHAIRIENGRIESRWSFYDLPYDRAIVPMPPEEAAEAVRDQVQQAVDRQMMSDVPVGALLSGGLDSSSVVACATRGAGGGNLDCFTIGFKDELFALEGNAEDLPYAKSVAEHLGVDLRTIYVGPEMAEELQRMIYSLDEPQADFAAINTYFICRLAREHGIKVLLSGAGGDDIFTGYRRHRAMGFEWRWGWLPQRVRRAFKGAASRLPTSSASTRRIAKALSYADLDGDERLASYFHWPERAILDSICSNEMHERLAGRPFSAPLMRSLKNVPEDVHEINRMLYLDCKHFLADHNLNYFDKMSMATGVEVRVPLLDPDLIDLAASLPVEYKQRGGEGKWIFKAAMEPLLPKQVIYRPKSGFGVPLRSWLRKELRPMVEDTLSAESLNRRGLFDAEGVQSMLERDRSGSIDAAYTSLSLMCIELWCRMFLDTSSPARP
ncbi:MAG: asparagine synthase (glutamine-hydrolyzing) [bacterium TMED88]|nr:asparagine synthase (glutamine-hydrolyzing) [Deltaproteobacteria bacterium]OUV34830.1 MAG: asparagine synthase (glutamine-hydrolyzing) [bacterium TMED88]